MQIRNKIFLACVNKSYSIEINRPTSSGGQGQYMKYVTFPWPLLDAALSIFNISCFVKKQFFLE
jgi:hypothetical protein